jgi:anaerobic ribonucleoside-triphosphate reductase activating protein
MEVINAEVRVHATLLGSMANGPGRRNVVWFQGCGRRCPGCFNPKTHPSEGGETVAVSRLADTLLAENPDGVTISGGEPFDQPDALLTLLRKLRRRSPLKSLLVFTGYTMDEVRGLTDGSRILEYLDILIAGPYVQSLHLGKGLLGSTNQTLHLLSTRHRLGEIDAPPAAEVVIKSDGTIVMSGLRDISK